MKRKLFFVGIIVLLAFGVVGVLPAEEPFIDHYLVELVLPNNTPNFTFNTNNVWDVYIYGTSPNLEFCIVSADRRLILKLVPTDLIFNEDAGMDGVWAFRLEKVIATFDRLPNKNDIALLKFGETFRIEEYAYSVVTVSFYNIRLSGTLDFFMHRELDRRKNE